MFKLKLLLFLGKFSKYFRGMVNNHVKELISSEIIEYLNKYQNTDFKLGEPIFLPHATSLEINIPIAHKNKDIDFSFLLEYVNGRPIEKSIIMTAGKFNDEFKMISDYFEYFKGIKDEQLIEFFKHI